VAQRVVAAHHHAGLTAADDADVRPRVGSSFAELDDVAADVVVVGGDVAAGPLPRETLERLLALGDGARFLRGNADRELGDFAAGRLTYEQRDFLASASRTLTLDVDGLGPTLFYHGSPRSDEEIITRLTPDERLTPMLAGVVEGVLVGGHTHVQFDRRAARRRIVNAGSVGMPYEDEPGAYWALLGPDVELRRTPYDLEAAVARVVASGYPDGEAWGREYVYAVNGPDEASRYFEQLASRR